MDDDATPLTSRHACLCGQMASSLRPESVSRSTDCSPAQHTWAIVGVGCPGCAYGHLRPQIGHRPDRRNQPIIAQLWYGGLCITAMDVFSATTGPYSPDNPNLERGCRGSSRNGHGLRLGGPHLRSTGDNVIFIEHGWVYAKTRASRLSRRRRHACSGNGDSVPTQPLVQPVAPAATSTPTTPPTDCPRKRRHRRDTHQHGHADGDAHPHPVADGNPVSDADAHAVADPGTAAHGDAAALLPGGEQASRREPSLLLASGFGSLSLAVVAGLALLVLRRLR